MQKNIFAVDQEARAIKILQENCMRQNIKNITTAVGDAFSAVSGKYFDVAIFCFFGTLEDIIPFTKDHCADKIILLKNDMIKKEGDIRPFTSDDIEYLKTHGIPYQYDSLVFEFGQPFLDENDMESFFELYQKSMPMRQAVIPIAHEHFSLYLPMQKRVGMIVLESNLL